jgi:hypothetical protein
MSGVGHYSSSSLIKLTLKAFSFSSIFGTCQSLLRLRRARGLTLPPCWREYGFHLQITSREGMEKSIIISRSEHQPSPLLHLNAT